MNNISIYQAPADFFPAPMEIAAPYIPAKTKTSLRSLISSKVELGLYFAAFFSLVLGLLLLAAPYWADYAIVNTLPDQASVAQVDEGYELVPLPPKDKSIPSELTQVTISKIGLAAPIMRTDTETHEDALRMGAWMPDSYSSPSEGGTVIIAAHRFGYLAWSNSFRRKNSFYNLPKVEVGDRVEITWHQRKYEYEVYSTTMDNKITDSQADLILYTCNDLVSDKRIFVYAKRLV